MDEIAHKAVGSIEPLPFTTTTATDAGTDVMVVHTGGDLGLDEGFEVGGVHGWAGKGLGRAVDDESFEPAVLCEERESSA